MFMSCVYLVPHMRRTVSLNPCLSLSIYIPPSNSSLEKLLRLFVILAFGLFMSFIINQHNSYTYLWGGHWQLLTAHFLSLYNSSGAILLAHAYFLWPPDTAQLCSHPGQFDWLGVSWVFSPFLLYVSHHSVTVFVCSGLYLLVGMLYLVQRRIL